MSTITKWTTQWQELFGAWPYLPITAAILMAMAGTFWLRTMFLATEREHASIYDLEQRLHFRHGTLAVLQKFINSWPYVSDAMRYWSQMLAALGWMRYTKALAMATGLISVLGLSVGWIYFASIWIALFFMVAGLSWLPIWLRLRLSLRQLKARSVFLPALETFYQEYIGQTDSSARHVLQRLVQQRRFPPEVQPLFLTLQRALATNVQLDQGLGQFSFAAGHVWAQHYAELLRVHLRDGVEIKAALYDLIRDMRQASVEHRQDRQRLLEIRVANFAPSLFFILFLVMNWRVNPDIAYQYYVVDEEGRRMIFISCLLILFSFVMGVALSVRRL